MADAPALVVGAGVGGLTTALCLARQGWAVVLVERAPLIEGVGAGLQISPNASRVLIDLGLEERLSALAFTPEAIEMRDGLTSEVAGKNRCRRCGLGALHRHLHRGDSIAVLLDAAVAHPLIDIRTGTEAVSVDQDGEPVRLATAIEDYDGALLVGADAYSLAHSDGAFR
ncbi:MAG: FAD-dependent oxidoreductase [Gammaproteobacteria bacterium]|nr:FAD-dependent oxidoreductase [Gammaproteobacteria bacterium]